MLGRLNSNYGCFCDGIRCLQKTQSEHKVNKSKINLMEVDVDYGKTAKFVNFRPF